MSPPFSPTTKPVISSYRQFWPFYLRQHAKPATRAWHIVGTSLAVAVLLAGIALSNGWLALAALPLGYGPAWYAHFVIEKNRPATFRYPLWSLVSDLRMTGLWYMGRLKRELDGAGIGPPAGTSG